jgi:hypothetical protein
MLLDIVHSPKRVVLISLFSMLAVGACSMTREPLPQIAAWTAAGRAPPPPQRQCPHVSHIDLHEIDRERREAENSSQREESRLRIQAMLDEITIPESSPHRPPPDADIVLRSVEPPGGMYPNTVWSVVWRDSSGQWWYWRQNRDPTVMPSPPPPPADPAEYPAYVERFTGWSPPDEERWPPESGRLNADQAAALEAALNDPCRAWEPDIWPWDPPRRGWLQRPAPPLPQDWTPTYVEIREGDRVRQIARPGHVDTLQGILVSVAAGPRP